MPVTRPSSARSLWLPLKDPLGAWCAVAVALLYTCFTMARDLSAYDSAELALAACNLGLAHPPGQPLHTLLGWLFCRLPGIPPLIGLSFLSALPAALTAIPALSLAEGLCQRERWLRAGVVAMFCLHPALWESASRVEIYSLATFFALWAAARVATTQGWFATGIAFGLAASVNPVVATIVALCCLPGIVAGRVPLVKLAHAAAGGLVGLLPYLYVPLVARRDPSVFIWGAPVGGEALLRFLRVADFSQKAGVPAGTLAGHLAEWVVWSARQGLLPLLLGGLFGALWLGSRDGCLWGRLFAPLLLGLSLLFMASNRVWRLDNPDYLGYLAAPLLVLSAGASAAVAALAARGGRFRLYAGILLVVLLASVVFSPPSLLARTRARDRVIRALAGSALAAAPRDAILVVASDHWVFPLVWLQEAEAERPDVVVLPFGLANSSWYWEHLFRRHPDLARIPLRGPSGSVGRVQRLLASAPSRPVLVERFGLAADLGLRVCPDGWFLRARVTCPDAPPEEAPTLVLTRVLAEVGSGSPSADGTITQVAYDRGEALWRLGQGAGALATLLSGVPASDRPAPTTLDSASVDRAPPLRTDLPAWRRQTALGDPGRNLFVAALLLRAAGDDAGAERHLRAAAALELPEAQP